MCAVTRRRFPLGANPTRRTLPAGSSRSSYGGDEIAEAFGKRVTKYGDSASVQAPLGVTVNLRPKGRLRPAFDRPPGQYIRAAFIVRFQKSLFDLRKDFMEPLVSAFASVSIIPDASL